MYVHVARRSFVCLETVQLTITLSKNACLVLPSGGKRDGALGSSKERLWSINLGVDGVKLSPRSLTAC